MRVLNVQFAWVFVSSVHVKHFFQYLSDISVQLHLIRNGLNSYAIDINPLSPEIVLNKLITGGF